MRNFEAFPQVRNLSIRRRLQARILGCERILTLKSFQRDTIVLEGCYKPLEDLFLMEEITLRRECEASFRLDSRCFRANYIDLWLHVMRNSPYLSNHLSAKPIGQGVGDEPVHYLKSNAAVSKLASFAASRGFRNPGIDHLLLGDHVQIHTEPKGTKFPKLSCNRGNIRRENRSSRPQVCDFEQAWKHLSLQSVFRAQTHAVQEYPTAFAVIRNIVRSFLGGATPDEIDNPRRIMHVHQYMEQQNDLGGVRYELQHSSCRDVTTIDSDPMQGISQHPAKKARPASSIYSRSARSLSPPTSPQHGSIAGSESDTVDSFIDSYQSRDDVSSNVNGAECHEFGGDVHGGVSQENQQNEDTSMLLSPGTSNNFPASTVVEAPVYSPRIVEGEVRRERLEVVKDGVGQAHDTLHESQKEGYRTNPHRIAKPQHYKKKKRLKQRQRHLTQVLQGHDNESRMTPAQREFIDLIEPKGVEVDNVCSTLSTGEVSEATSLELAMPQLVHDDGGINMQGSANQWHTNNEDDDVQTGTRKAEEQMYGAEDAVNEVYDDEPACQTQQTREDEIGDGINGDEKIHIPSNTTNDLFPGGPIEPTPDSSIVHHEPTHSVKALAVIEKQAETSDGGISVQDKREVIHHERGSIYDADNGAIPQIQEDTNPKEESSTAVVSEGPVKSTNPRESMFPGGPITPGSLKQVTQGGQWSSATPTFSRKRNLPRESEDSGVHLRAPKASNRTQKNSWEPFKDTVDAVGRVWGDLDYARIYVTSSVNIGELSIQQHPNQERLWSWLKDDQELFDRQMSLLRKKFGFQVICSDPQGRRYRSLEHMEYWNAYFGSNQPGYWLAVLTQWRSAGASWEKVRKTHDDRRH